MYDRELLDVVYAVEKWHHYLSALPFIIKTYQRSLKYLLEKHLSTPSQYSWLTNLMGLTYEIQYKKGRENGVVDALARATHEELLQMTISNISTELRDLIKKEWVQDKKLAQLIQQLQQHLELHPKFKWKK